MIKYIDHSSLFVLASVITITVKLNYPYSASWLFTAIHLPFYNPVPLSHYVLECDNRGRVAVYLAPNLMGFDNYESNLQVTRGV